MAATGNSQVLPSRFANKQGALKADEPDIFDIRAELVRFFFKGAKVIPRIPTSNECLNASRDLTRTLYGIHENIDKKGFNFDTYTEATKTVGAAQPVIKTCFESNYQFLDETHNWLNHFSSTLSFIGKFFLNQIYSGYRWYDITKSFMESMSEGNYTKMAYFSGKATYVLFDFDETVKSPSLLSSSGLSAPIDIAVFFEKLASNFLVGIFDLAYNFLDGAAIFESKTVATCENAINEFKSEYKSAVADIKEHTYKSIKSGVYKIADLFEKFGSVNELCVSGVKSAIDQVEMYKRMRKAPLEILRNFVWNHRKVYKHMMQTVECLFNLDSTCIGFSSGRLVDEIDAKD